MVQTPPTGNNIKAQINFDFLINNISILQPQFQKSWDVL